MKFPGMKKIIVIMSIFMAAGIGVSAQGDVKSKLSNYYAVQNEGVDTAAFNIIKEVYLSLRESGDRDIDVMDKYVQVTESFLSYFTLCTPEEEDEKGANACAMLVYEHNQINTVLLPEGYSMRAEAKLMLNDFLGAIEDYNAAIKLKDDNASYFTNRGNVKYKMKDSKGALEDFDKSISIDPTNPAVYYNKGMVLLKDKDYPNAANAFTKSIEFDRTNTKTMLYKAISEYMNDSKEVAMNTLNELLALEPNNSEALYYQGMIQYKNKDFAAAKDTFAKSVAADEKNEKSWYFLGISAFNIQDKDTACTSWAKAVELGYDKAQKLIDEHCKAE